MRATMVSVAERGTRAQCCHAMAALAFAIPRSRKRTPICLGDIHHARGLHELTPLFVSRDARNAGISHHQHAALTRRTRIALCRTAAANFGPRMTVYHRHHSPPPSSARPASSCPPRPPTHGAVASKPRVRTTATPTSHRRSARPRRSPPSDGSDKRAIETIFSHRAETRADQPRRDDHRDDSVATSHRFTI